MVPSVGSVPELVAAQAAGGRFKFLFFWGHQPEREGGAGAGCLSQWWSASFTADGLQFATAEHFMMWRKATLFDDFVMAERILAAPHPHAAKAFGGRVAGFDQQRWDERRLTIVVAGNLAKFGQHAPLRVEVQIGRDHRGHEHDSARGDAGEHEVRRGERSSASRPLPAKALTRCLVSTL